MMIDLSVFTPGNLASSVIAGVVSGLYWVIYHPPGEGSLARRAIIVGWFFGFPLSVLYLARIAIATYRNATEPDYVNDAPRVVAAWILSLIFSTAIAIGAWLGTRWRIRRARKRLR